jgi:alpha-L-arabinofuranosidase
VALQTVVAGPCYEGRRNGRAAFVDASAILDPARRRLHVFLGNRSPEARAEVAVAPADFALAACANAEILTGPGADACNTFEQGETVRSQPLDGVRVTGGQAACDLPPLSFAAMTFDLE